MSSLYILYPGSYVSQSVPQICSIPTNHLLMLLKCCLDLHLGDTSPLFKTVKMVHGTIQLSIELSRLLANAARSLVCQAKLALWRICVHVILLTNVLLCAKVQLLAFHLLNFFIIKLVPITGAGIFDMCNVMTRVGTNASMDEHCIELINTFLVWKYIREVIKNSAVVLL